MTTLLDTNILTRTAQPARPMHQPAVDAVAELRRQGEELCLVPQNFYEFWVVATRPAAQNGLGLSVAEAQAELGRLRALFRLFDDTPAILATWEQLVTDLQRRRPSPLPDRGPHSRPGPGGGWPDTPSPPGRAFLRRYTISHSAVEPPVRRLLTGRFRSWGGPLCDEVGFTEAIQVTPDGFTDALQKKPATERFLARDVRTRRRWLAGCLTLLLVSLVGCGGWLGWSSQRGWTPAKAERLIQAEVPPGCDRPTVEKWFDRHGIHYSWWEGETARANQVGLRHEDLSGALIGQIDHPEANVDLIDRGRLQIYFFFDKQGRLAGHLVHADIPEFMP